MLRWARDNGCPWHSETSAAAACGGHAHILAFANENGCPVHPRPCLYAAYGGNLGMLHWLRDEGFILDSGVYGHACEAGNIEVLKHLEEENHWFAKPEDACERAAFGGHLDVLVWLRDSGFPWTWRVRLAAEQGGYRRLLQWADDDDCPIRRKRKQESLLHPFAATNPHDGEATILPLVCPIHYSRRFDSYLAMQPELL